MAINPIQAANILFGVWEVLHGAPEEAQQDSGTRIVEVETRGDRDYEALKERYDRLVLVVHAMWTLVAEKTAITDADLAKQITDLDAADGTVDGRVTAPPVQCSCGAMVCRKMKRCMFCGKPYEAGTTFDTL